MRRILIIKGPGESFHRLTKVLSDAQYDVLEVESGEEALQIGPSMTPDVILVSIVLPNWNGLEVAASLRNVQALQDATIILLGYVEPVGIHDEPLASLVDGYLNVESSAPDVIAYIETRFVQTADDCSSA